MHKRVHITGIGGTGMSAIALILLARGYQVSGSDTQASAYLHAVESAGAQVVVGHAPHLAKAAEVLLRSSAIKDTDPEVQAALEAGVPVLKRSQFLPELLGNQACLAVAGSHGKTTTTAMLIHLLQQANEDPSYILGARLISSTSNAGLGSGQYIVVEADEYDRMFLGLNPLISVVTNVQHDHPDCFPTIREYQEAFVQFLERSTRAVLLCGDDAGVQAILDQVRKQKHDSFTFGFHESCDYHLLRLVQVGLQTQFELEFKGNPLGVFSLPLPGNHNALNAAAALAVLHQLDIPFPSNALQEFKGTERRFELSHQLDGVLIYDDYGHHPTQIAATLEAARALHPEARIWAVWEPHTYSRTKALQEDFIQALQAADTVLITKIYAAREADDGSTPAAIAYGLNQALYFESFRDLARYVGSHTTGNDVLVVLSAGKGPQLSQLIAEELEGDKACN